MRRFQCAEAIACLIGTEDERLLRFAHVSKAHSNDGSTRGIDFIRSSGTERDTPSEYERLSPHSLFWMIFPVIRFTIGKRIRGCGFFSFPSFFLPPHRKVRKEKPR